MLSGRAVRPKNRGAHRLGPQYQSAAHDAAAVAGLPMPLSGSTELFAIVGDPIAQAGSPIVFNTAFRQLGRQAVLVPLQVSAPSFPSFIKAMRQIQNLRGLIVTKPHKTAVTAHVDGLGPHARKARSVNAIRCGVDGAWTGENFDGVGFRTGLEAAGQELTGKRVLLAVGPDGGWNPFELDLLQQHGFSTVSVGPRILRTDTACVALLALVHERLAT